MEGAPNGNGGALPLPLAARFWGEVGLRSNAGEGESPRVDPADAAPHPNPLSPPRATKSGAREREELASLTEVKIVRQSNFLLQRPLPAPPAPAFRR
jgi:hypothetical protein